MCINLIVLLEVFNTYLMPETIQEQISTLEKEMAKKYRANLERICYASDRFGPYSDQVEHLESLSNKYLIEQHDKLDSLKTLL